MPHRVWRDIRVDADIYGVAQVRMRLGRRDEQQDAAWVGLKTAAVAIRMGGHVDGAAASRAELEAVGAAIDDGRLELLIEDHSDFMGALEHALGTIFLVVRHLERFRCEADSTVGLLLCTDGLTAPLEVAARCDGVVGHVELVDGDVTATIAALW